MLTNANFELTLQNALWNSTTLHNILIINVDTPNEILDEAWSDIEDRFGGYSSLLPLEFENEDDRYSSDHLDISQIKYDTPYDYTTIDLHKDFHNDDYEYLIEDIDLFENGEDEPYAVSSFTAITIIVCMFWFNGIVFLIFFLMVCINALTPPSSYEAIGYEYNEYKDNNDYFIDENELYFDEEFVIGEISYQDDYPLPEDNQDDGVDDDDGLDSEFRNEDESFNDLYKDIEDYNLALDVASYTHTFVDDIYYAFATPQYYPDDLYYESAIRRASFIDPGAGSGVLLMEGDAEGQDEHLADGENVNEGEGEDFLNDIYEYSTVSRALPVESPGFWGWNRLNWIFYGYELGEEYEDVEKGLVDDPEEQDDDKEEEEDIVEEDIWEDSDELIEFEEDEYDTLDETFDEDVVPENLDYPLYAPLGFFNSYFFAFLNYIYFLFKIRK
jgi:hypothetical protein